MSSKKETNSQQDPYQIEYKPGDWVICIADTAMSNNPIKSGNCYRVLSVNDFDIQLDVGSKYGSTWSPDKARIRPVVLSKLDKAYYGIQEEYGEG